MTSEPYRLSLSDARSAIRSRRISVSGLMKSCLRRIDEMESDVHAWAHLDPEVVLRAARDLDEGIASGADVGPLAGIPIGIKDIFNTREFPTQMGSPIWKGFTPGNDARVVHSLRMAGAVIMGKTVTAEFAVHTPGPTANPHNVEFMPGTSSSGSAAAVASSMVPAATGTQTAGSIIRPASYCGVYGMKPSFGLLPRTGMLKTTDSLDSVGFFARAVSDLDLLLEVMRVKGPDYPYADSISRHVVQGRGDNEPWRVGVIKGPKWNDLETYARAKFFEFVGRLAELSGLEVVFIEDPPSLSEAHETHGTIYDRSLAYYFSEEFRQKTLVSRTMYEIVERGMGISLDVFKRALSTQVRIASDLDHILQKECDVAITLSTGGEPLKGLCSTERPDSCLVWTLCGSPVINLPVFVGPHGLPFGAQVFARRYHDLKLLSFVRFLEQRDLVPVDTFPRIG